MPPISIVDVSRYQLVTDEASKIVHLFLTKASQGLRKNAQDDQLENTYMVTRRNANTDFSPYHYFWRSTAANNGKRQAENMARILEALVAAQGGAISDLRWNAKPLVWLDLDPVYSAGGEPAISPQLLEKQIWQFIESSEALLGAEVGIYTSQYAWSSVTGAGAQRTTEIPRRSSAMGEQSAHRGQPADPLGLGIALRVELLEDLAAQLHRANSGDHETEQPGRAGGCGSEPRQRRPGLVQCPVQDGFNPQAARRHAPAAGGYPTAAG